MDPDPSLIASYQFAMIDFVVLVLCLAVNAIFSAADTAIVTFGQLKAKQLAEESATPSGYLKLWLDHPERVNATIITINTITIALAAILLFRISTNTTSDVAVPTFMISILVLVFGKILPKAWARARYEKIALPALKMIWLVHLIIFPVVYAFSLATESFFKAAGGTSRKGMAITEEELEYLVNEGEKAGMLEETKKEMIVSVFDFGETKVREIMTPRTDIIALACDDSVEDAIKLASESGHSRIPVYQENIDQIVGTILAKDLLATTLRHKDGPSNHHSNQGGLKKLCRQPYFVPESKLIMDVFKDLKRTKNHIAIVIDEYGGTAGIVTMEDILEEIVGEIQDEHDTEEAKIIEIEPGICDVVGSINIDEFFEYFGLDRETVLGPDEQDADTIAGYMTQKLGDLPEVGATVKIGPLNVEIVEVKRHRIHTVRVSKIIASGEA